MNSHHYFTPGGARLTLFTSNVRTCLFAISHVARASIPSCLAGMYKGCRGNPQDQRGVCPDRGRHREWDSERHRQWRGKSPESCPYGDWYITSCTGHTAVSTPGAEVRNPSRTFPAPSLFRNWCGLSLCESGERISSKTNGFGRNKRYEEAAVVDG